AVPRAVRQGDAAAVGAAGTGAGWRWTRRGSRWWRRRAGDRGRTRRRCGRRTRWRAGARRAAAESRGAGAQPGGCRSERAVDAGVSREAVRYRAGRIAGIVELEDAAAQLKVSVFTTVNCAFEVQV